MRFDERFVTSCANRVTESMKQTTDILSHVNNADRDVFLGVLVRAIGLLPTRPVTHSLLERYDTGKLELATVNNSLAVDVGRSVGTARVFVITSVVIRQDSLMSKKS